MEDIQMKLKKMGVSDLEQMKVGSAKVFEYKTPREYETAKTICSRYGRIFDRRFSVRDNHDNTFIVMCKARDNESK